MTHIPVDLHEPLKVGDADITALSVAPLSFVAFARIWKHASYDPKPQVAMQRARFIHQAHFMAGDKRMHPTNAELAMMPRTILAEVRDLLDAGQGIMGEKVGEGNGVTSPVVYKLGQPIKTKNSSGEVVDITELEFLAATYAEVEDVWAEENDLAQALLLTQTVAKPLGSPLLRLTGAMVDEMTTADGVGIQRLVLPSF